MIPIPPIAIYALTVAVALAGATWKGYNWGHGVATAEFDKAVSEGLKREMSSLQDALTINQSISIALNDKLDKQKLTRTIDRGVIEREIKTDIKYINVCLPDNGLRIWNAISSGSPLMSDGIGGLKLDKTVSPGNGTTSR
jgi:hypothetical protein